METKEVDAQLEQKVFKYVVLDALSENNNYFLVKVEENEELDFDYSKIKAKSKKEIIELKTKLVLYPGCVLEFNSEILEADYTLRPSSLISVPEAVTRLNSDNISGKVVSYNKRVREIEVKLDEKISVKNKTYSSLRYYYHIFDKDVLVGMKVSGIKIDRKSFFYYGGEFIHPDDEKKLKDMLCKQDLSLIKRSKFLVNTAMALFFGVMFIGIILSTGSTIVALNIEYTKPNIGLFLLVISIILFLSFIINLMFENYDRKYKKDDLKSPFKLINITTYIAILLVISLLFFTNIRIYQYNSSYVYDNIKNEIIDDSSFMIDGLKDINVAKIKERYIPVYDEYSFSFYLKTKKQKEFVMIDFDIRLKFDKELLLSFPEIISEIEKDFQIKLNELDYQNLSIDSKDINSEKIFINIKEMFIKDLEEKGVLLDQIDSIETTTRLSELE